MRGGAALWRQAARRQFDRADGRRTPGHHPDQHADDPVAPQTVWESLSATDLPRLWLPGRNNLFQIDALPILGTGKTDLRTIKLMAAEKAAG